MLTLKEKSVALIIPDFDWGGEEKRVVFFANNYVDHFKSVYIFAPSGLSEGLLRPEVIHIKIDVRKLQNILKISTFIKTNGIDFLQGHKRVTLPYLFMIERVNRIKCFFNFDNIYLKGNWLCSLISPSHIAYLSEKVAAYYANYYKNKKNKVINMGGDFFNVLPQDSCQELKKQLGINEEFILTSLGRLSEQKNHRLLISTLKELENQPYICLIIGGGPLEPELKSLVEQYGLSKKIKFLGHRSDIEQLLNISNVLIQSSIFEGFPNVFIEAGSIGLPIIATDVGSSSVLVLENGILIESGDKKGLATAILKMINNYSKYKDAAVALSKSSYFSMFHKNNMVNNYLRYFKEDLT